MILYYGILDYILIKDRRLLEIIVLDVYFGFINNYV